MRTVKIAKDALYQKIQGNLEAHLKEYQEACVGYRQQAIAALNARVDKLQSGETVGLDFYDLDMPTSHEDEYRCVLEMLKMSVDDAIELTHDEFQQYVQDNWSWKQHFTVSAMKYRHNR